MPTMEDAVLVKLSLSGDRSAFGKLVDRYKNLVYGMLLSRIGDFDQAEDLAQDAFIRAYEHLESLRRHAGFSNWVCGIAMNLCNAWRRRRERESEVLRELISSQEGAGTILTFQEASRPETPEEEYASLELRQSVWRAVEELPEGSREAILLFYLNEMSSIEIAEFLGITPSAVRSRLQSGREQLRDRMMPFVEEAIEERRLKRSFTQKVVAALPRTPFSEPKPLLPLAKWGLSLKANLAGMGALVNWGVRLKTILVGICVLAGIGGVVVWMVSGGGGSPASDVRSPMQVRLATLRERTALLYSLEEEERAESSRRAYGWGRDTDLSTVSASFIGGETDEVGVAGSIAGDVNGDGYDDIVIGALGDDYGGWAAGKVYLILGRSSGWRMDTDLSAVDASFIGEDWGGGAGTSVSIAGDVNGDGYNDILIAAYNNNEGGTEAGQVYLILGKPSGWRMDTDLSAVDASFIGEHAGDKAG